MSLGAVVSERSLFSGILSSKGSIPSGPGIGFLLDYSCHSRCGWFLRWAGAPRRSGRFSQGRGLIVLLSRIFGSVRFAISRLAWGTVGSPCFLGFCSCFYLRVGLACLRLALGLLWGCIFVGCRVSVSPLFFSR